MAIRRTPGNESVTETACRYDGNAMLLTLGEDNELSI